MIRRGQRLSGIAKLVDDRIAAVAAEILPRDLHAGRGLSALVFSDVEQARDAGKALPDPDHALVTRSSRGSAEAFEG